MEKSGIARVQALVQKEDCRVVLMPAFQSLVDLMMLHYVKYLQDLGIGFTLLNSNQDKGPLSNFLSSLGCLFTPSSSSTRSTTFVNCSLLQEIIMDN